MMLDEYTGEDDAERADVARTRTEATFDRASSLHVTGSAFVVHLDSRRVLLRWHQRMQRWMQVGGHFDPGETDALTVALREAREETALDDLRPFTGEPLQVVIVPVPAGAEEPAHEHADIRYLLVTDHPDDVRPEHPDALLRWVDLEAAVDEVPEENQRVFLHRIITIIGK
jgi:8-oxo-dGTP pyrophosphatase MutT (NUDIX family)